MRQSRGSTGDKKNNSEKHRVTIRLARVASETDNDSEGKSKIAQPTLRVIRRDYSVVCLNYLPVLLFFAHVK